MHQSPTHKSDTELLSGCLNGDFKCREAFVRRFSDLVFATVHRAARVKNIRLSQQNIEDLHQSVFLQLFDRECRKLKQYKGKNGCSLASWIRILTSRVVLDHLRRGTDILAHRHRSLSVELACELNAPEPSPLDQLSAAEQWNRVESALKQLKARDQLVIRLHILEDRPLPQVAQALGIGQKNIHSVKHRAVQRLKTIIKRSGNI